MNQLKSLLKNKQQLRPLFTISIIALTTLIGFGVGVFSLKAGINTIFQNLLYIPIIIACIYFTKRGFIYSVAVAIGYFILMAFFPHDASILGGALIRVFIFILIAAVIAFLASGRFRAEQALQESEAKGRRNSVLNQMTKDVNLQQILDLLVHYTEEEDKTITGSILLFDPVHHILLPGTAPNMPVNYWALLEPGLPIGANMLCCGTAAYTRKLAIASDIQNDPCWLPFSNFIEKAREHKIRACWSMPILSSTGALLGTFANYSNQIGEPTSENLETLKWAVEMAGIIIEKKHSEDGLRESEARFSLIFHANPAPIAITRINDNLLIDTNVAWETTIGFSRVETIGHTPAELNLWVNPEQRNHIIEDLLAKRMVRQEVQVRCKSGDIRDLLMSAEKIELAGEAYLLTMAQDITERLKAEKALQKSERHAHALISAIPDIIFTLSSEGVFMDYKAAKEDLYLSPELFIGKNISEVMPGWFAELACDKISKTISSGDIIIFEYSLPINETRDAYFECRMVPYPDNEVLAIVRNISERKEFERRIKESEANARAIMESTSDLVVLLDKDGKVIDCNEAHASRLKTTRNEILGKIVFNYFPEELLITRKALVNKVLITGKPVVGEDFRAGFWNEFVINPVHNSEGQVDHVAVFSRDITEKKQFIELLKEMNKNLLESEERFRKIFEDSSVGIALVRKDFRFIKANSVFCNMVGISYEDLKFHTFKEITHRDNIAGDMEGVRRLLSEELQVYKTEKKYIRKDESIVWANANISVIRNQTGEFLYFLAIIEDITQRKQAETLIKTSEERYRTLFESLSQGIFFQSANGKIIDTNDAALRMFGLTRDQFLGIDSFDPRWKVINENNEILPPDKHPSMVALLTGKPAINQMAGVFIPESGTHTWLIVDAIPQFRPGETKPYQVFASMQDITRRKMAEEAQKEAEQRFKTMFERHQAVMLLIEPYSGAVVDANISASEFYGYSIETLRGMNIDQINCDPPEQIKAERLNALNEKRNYFIFLHKLSNGETRTVEVHSTPITFGKQKILFSIIHDITQRKKTEIQLQQSEQNLRELNAQKDKFFSIIAHDLKSPFNSILGFSELMVEQVNNHDYDGIGKYAGIILQSSKNAVGLLINLMEWARSQTGRIEFIPEYFEMVNFIKDIIPIFTDIAGQKSITIKLDLPPNVTAFADKAMISTVLRNLISNAIKFTKPGGEIIISATENQTEIMVSLKDNGVGIPREAIGKLFRIDENYTTSGTNNERGTGLGLILCKEFIEKHDGKIWAESQQGEGSIFHFSLPKINKADIKMF